MLDDLRDIDPIFKLTWANKREDMKDNSPSGHTMSLASTTALAGWRDQEIADLIIAFYRRHKLNVKKAMRPDYIGKTIAKAKKTVNEQIVKNYTDNIEPSQGTEYQSVVDPGNVEAKKFVCAQLGLDIIKIEQYEQEDDSYYRLHLNIFDTELMDLKRVIVPFENEKELMTFRLFKQKIFGKTRILVNVKPSIWNKCLNNFGLFMVIIKTGDQTTEERMSAWINEYLDDKEPATREDTVLNHEPFIYKKHWWLYIKKFDLWCWQGFQKAGGIKVTRRDLKIIGSKNQRFDIPNPVSPNSRKTIWPYKIPHNIIIPPKFNEDEIEDE